MGTGLNAEPEYIELVIENLAEQTGFELRTAEHLVQATQSMAPMLAVSAALRGLAVDLAKIAEDLLLMSSGPRTGFAEIKLPARQPGSSIMPGKVNPVMVENLSMICYHVIGLDTAVAWARRRGQLELNVMMPIIAHDVLEALTILTSGCRQFARECVAGIEADEERAAWLLEQSSRDGDAARAVHRLCAGRRHRQGSRPRPARRSASWSSRRAYSPRTRSIRSSTRTS